MTQTQSVEKIVRKRRPTVTWQGERERRGQVHKHTNKRRTRTRAELRALAMTTL